MPTKFLPSNVFTPVITILTQNEWLDCIKQFIHLDNELNSSPEDLAGTTYELYEDLEELDSDFETSKAVYTYFCRDPPTYKRCWNGVVDKINDCNPGQGTASGAVYLAMFDNTCSNMGLEAVGKFFRY